MGFFFKARALKKAADAAEAQKKCLIEKTELADYLGQLAAINKSQAVIEFTLDGKIITANENFLNTLGYTLPEIAGMHHSMFVEAGERNSGEYRQFWDRLKRGEFDAGEYRRIGKGGREIWIQATYNPIMDEQGQPFKVVKYAVDVTAQKLCNADFQGQLDAISKSQAVIEFTLTGDILTANKNFLDVMGYRLDEIQGKHHSLFVDPAYKSSAAYKQFWAKLGRGEFDAGEYKRFGKGGKEVWITASYNPIMDMNGKPIKIVKYAADLTAQKLRNADFEGQIAAISKSQAVIEFRMDGTIIHANQNFLNAVGYSLSEVAGKHHSMFVAPAYAAGTEYKLFWERLNRGEFDAGEYLRIGKGGKQIWIQASYNPIMDLNGKPIKVVKYATDITKQKELLNVEKLVTETKEVMTAVAAGRLDREMSQYEGEFAVLAGAVNDCIHKLKEIVTEINDGAHNMSEQARNISRDSLVIKDRTQEQAASLEETAAAMEQMTATVKQNADNVSTANVLASEVREKAERGGEVVKQVSLAMQDISTASAQIAEIISVIDMIAFQTNLLALNAAVEAARAGEHGRGFAVVASEVGELAKRSASSAKQIKSLIQDSATKVANGNRLVDTSRKSLDDIVDAVKKVSDLIKELATSSSEQYAGIEQVNLAVTQLDQATQENSARVDETSNAAEAMDELAGELIKTMQFFSIEEQKPVWEQKNLRRPPPAFR
ncbi:MAG: methyl-accepting chemotaxis protein [Pseudomonadota bacterium]